MGLLSLRCLGIGFTEVILNTRSDIVAWRDSSCVTLETYDQDLKNWDWCKSCFWYAQVLGTDLTGAVVFWTDLSACAELFWARQYTSRTQLPGFFAISFASNSVWRYQEHIAMVRGIGLPSDRLPEWQVADEWAPLHEFSGEPVPTGVAFPQGNPLAAWAQRVGEIMHAHERRALRNTATFAALIVACSSWMASVVLRVHSGAGCK
jgi:hypothetical protein